jgi:tRNA uridine 5-carbamoylmethylation protein Kti12
MMAGLTLVIMRGLPGSGKTTYAREWVAEDRARRARVNRDDLRAMLDDSVFVAGVTERRIVTVRDAAILALLAAGVSVISDDTNLADERVADLAGLAGQVLADTEIVDLTGVPLETCLERNASRTGPGCVPEDVIRGMHAQYIARVMPGTLQR